MKRVIVYEPQFERDLAALFDGDFKAAEKLLAGTDWAVQKPEFGTQSKADPTVWGIFAGYHNQRPILFFYQWDTSQPNSSVHMIGAIYEDQTAVT